MFTPEVGSAIFIGLICACLTSVVFDLRILWCNLLSHLHVLWVWYWAVMYCNTLKVKGQVRTHCHHCCLGSFHPSVNSYARSLDSVRASMSTSVLNMNKWFNFSFFFMSKTNKNPDTVFHTQGSSWIQSILEIVVVKQGLANYWLFLQTQWLRPQPHSCTLVLYSFSCYLWPLLPPWQSWAVATETVWSSESKLFTLWPFPEKNVAAFALESGWSWRGPIATRRPLVHLFT